MEILSVENLSFSYPNSKKKTLCDINLKINEGKLTLLCGKTGCGKTTLLKMIKKELAPAGETAGTINRFGLDLPTDIGFVMQNPESQIVTDTVSHELAFGLENIGVPSEEIRRRISEISSFFGINSIFNSSTSEISGGQKQLLNLASVIVCSPKILILDEPTSQLDPIAAQEFISTLKKLNTELGLTILLTEHHLEDIFPIADRVILMDNGKIITDGTPRESAMKMDGDSWMSLPTATRIHRSIGSKASCPLSVKEGRQFLSDHFKNTVKELPKAVPLQQSEAVLEIKDVWFRYTKKGEDIIKDLNLTVYKNEILSIVGGNGSGKTTLLNLAAGLIAPYQGKIKLNGKNIKDYKDGSLYKQNVSLLPQNPQLVFLKETVLEDLKEIDPNPEEVIHSLKIEDILQSHPYDLSGGEQQKAALAKILLLSPKILLLDEPTKGIDSASKLMFSEILNGLKENGITVIIVTHDVEFAAEISNRCAMLFNGEIISVSDSQSFFSGNHYYTTAANRMSSHMYYNAVTCNDVIKLIRKNEEYSND
ncbi:MAG: ATP-binding cassette domain-containing protein [Bacillota bacterium]|nr:ATP-binding cassette domain-containing protein [Bacillota bacterium]